MSRALGVNTLALSTLALSVVAACGERGAPRVPGPTTARPTEADAGPEDEVDAGPVDPELGSASAIVSRLPRSDEVRFALDLRELTSHPTFGKLGPILAALTWPEALAKARVEPLRDVAWIAGVAPSLSQLSSGTFFVRFRYSDAAVRRLTHAEASSYAKGGPMDAGAQEATLTFFAGSEHVLGHPRPRSLVVAPRSAVSDLSSWLVAPHEAEGVQAPADVFVLEIDHPSRHVAAPRWTIPDGVERARIRVVPRAHGARVEVSATCQDAASAHTFAAGLEAWAASLNRSMVVRVATAGLLEQVVPKVDVDPPQVRLDVDVSESQLERLRGVVAGALGAP